jgi:hypothetical protein
MNGIYSSLLVTLFLMLACGNEDVNDNLKQESMFPSCDQLEIIELSFLNAQFVGDRSDTLQVKIRNNCKSCTQYVYTGLIAYADQDTLAIDVLFTSQLSPVNGESREYLLKATNPFETKDITRLEMYQVCDSISL